MTETPSRVAVVLYPGCTIVEVAEAATRLANAGISVSFVASTDIEFEDQSGLRMRAHQTFSDIGTGPLSAVIVPGGDALSILDDDQALGFISTHARAGAFVAGICAGVLIMGRAGVLQGRRITHNYRTPWAPADLQDFAAPQFIGADVVEDRTLGVVIDENIVTALPNASIEFALRICTLMGVYTTQRADMISRHLRGEFVAPLFQE